MSVSSLIFNLSSRCVLWCFVLYSRFLLLTGWRQVRYLMAEAGTEAIVTDQKRQLRKRRSKSSTTSSFDHFHFDNVHANQPVARVKQGFVIVGHVEGEADSDDRTESKEEGEGEGEERLDESDRRWQVVFGKETVRMGWAELRPCLLEYAQYEVDMQQLERKAQANTSSLSVSSCS